LEPMFITVLKLMEIHMLVMAHKLKEILAKQ
jgi:hypothetical protein